MLLNKNKIMAKLQSVLFLDKCSVTAISNSSCFTFKYDINKCWELVKPLKIMDPCYFYKLLFKMLTFYTP